MSRRQLARQGLVSASFSPRSRFRSGAQVPVASCNFATFATLAHHDMTRRQRLGSPYTASSPRFNPIQSMISIQSIHAQSTYGPQYCVLTPCSVSICTVLYIRTVHGIYRSALSLAYTVPVLFTLRSISTQAYLYAVVRSIN